MSLPSNPNDTHDSREHIADEQTRDAVEEVVSVIPIVLPMVGAVLMFLLAFIAISMA